MTTQQRFPTLNDLVTRVSELRPLSPVAARIIELNEDQQFSAHELATVISSDQALTAKLLRLSNSAYYGFPRQIGTVRDAVVLLGFRQVRSSTLATCLIDSAPGSTHLNYQDFWHFSITVGMLAEVLARTEGVLQDEAFTAGVLHNIGLLALDQHVPEALGASVSQAREHGISLIEAEQDVLGYTHLEVGGALCLYWNFPNGLARAASEHLVPLPQIVGERSLRAYVTRARDFARARGLSDGLGALEPVDPREEWQIPPLSVQLDRAGGESGLLERVEAFLNSAIAG